MSSWHHSKKKVREALKEIEALGWRVTQAKGGTSKKWGDIKCPYKSGTCGMNCIRSVASTPGKEHVHAEQLLKFVQRCEKVNKGK